MANQGDSTATATEPASIAAMAAMLAEREVAAVAVRYCWLIDTGAWDQLDSVFTPDAMARILGVDFVGLDAIRDRIASALGPLDASQHLVTNHEVAVEGPTATHRCYFQAQHVRASAGDQPLYTVAGRYDDRLRSTDAGWRIEHRVLTVLWTDGNEAVLRPR